jgi:Ca2+-binding EF-hand superfamily protein
MVEKAFQEIDDDGSGMLSVNEMKQALFAASPVKGKQDEEKDTLDMRFRELDLNGDGDVEFKEFLYGVVSWVGMTSEEEMDDIAIEADG